MKYRHIVVLILISTFLPLIIRAQIPSKQNKTDKKGNRQGEWAITYNQNWIPTDKPDSIVYYRLISYKNNKPQNTTTDYYRSGQKQFEGKLLADRPQDIITGTGTWYHENGALSSEVNFVDGLREGPVINFYPSKRKYSESIFKKGLLQGKVTYYSEEGEIINIEFYENGEKLPLQKIWDKTIALYNNRAYAEAEPALKDFYIAIRYTVGADGGNCAYVLYYLWSSQTTLKKHAEALKNAEEMGRVRELQNIPKDSTYRDWLYESLLLYKNVGDYNAMERPFLKVVSIEKEISGEKSVRYLAYKRYLGDYYTYQKRFAEGEKIYLENIQEVKKQFPNQPGQYSYETASLAHVYEEQQEYGRAEKLYLDAIVQYRIQKDTTKNFGAALDRLINLFIPQAKYQEAIPFAQELVALQKARKGTLSFEYTDALTSLSKCYRESEQFDKAEPIVKERVAIVEKIYSQNSKEYVDALFALALLYGSQNDIGRAEPYYLQMLDLQKRINPQGETDEAYLLKRAEVLGYLGWLYAKNNNVIKAELTLSECFQILRKLKDQDDFIIATTYERIGTSQLRIRNYPDAEDAYKEAIRITEKVYGTNHHNYYTAVSNLGVLYTYSGRANLAVKTYDELLQKVFAGQGNDNPTYIVVLESKVLALQALGQDSVVIALHKVITAYYLKKFGETSPSYFKQLSAMILRQIHGNQLKDAEENIGKLVAAALKRGIKKTDKAYYGDILSLKLALANGKKDYKQVIVIAKEMKAIGRTIGDPKLGTAELGMNYFMTGQMKEAVEAYQEYINLMIDEVQHTFPYLSESQKVGFYNSEIEYHLDLYYYIALAEPLNMKVGLDSATTAKAKEARKKIHYIKHPNVANIFNYQLVTKGILFEANQKMKEAILDSKDETLIRLFDEWQVKKEKLNKIFLAPESPQKELSKNQVNAEIKAIEKQLTLKSSYFLQTNTPSYTWRDVQKKLKKGEALVEILAVSAGQRINGEKYSDFYLGFVITPETKNYPLCVKIESGDSLEGKYAKNYQNSVRLKLPDARSYNKYWKFLADTLKGVSKIYFAPDGVYHKVNINTLMNPETGKYVLEEKEIQFISQARDLITRREGVLALPKDIVLFGAPDYNNLPKDKIQESNEAKERSIGAASERALTGDSTQRFIRGAQIAELPGTEAEVKNIEIIAGKNQLHVQKFLGVEANEAALKEVRTPSILHIATHGFFIPENINTSATGNESTRDGFANFTTEDLRNPLRRSGLLFSFCKQAFSLERNKVDLPEDGILTAEEAQNLHLDKTEMVVLSACETGLGDVRNGEGVYGLQRAFQTAGAKSVLMSLWTVSDQATQELMTEFYAQWFELKDRRKAFREAQLKIKQNYKDPFYWGAFVMVGD